MPLPTAQEIWRQAELLDRLAGRERRQAELPAQIVLFAGYGIVGAALFLRLTSALLGSLHGLIVPWTLLAVGGAGAMALFLALDGLSDPGS
ncbi:MAG TPA: hypothetical protein VMM92_01115 [Thermoanaerobaculia bacterium]|nr:hypothetical protein [Thermoanaerobaculia bacterium]